MPPRYDCASASPDFANGAVTGAFSYAAGASYTSGNNSVGSGELSVADSLAIGAPACNGDTAYACTSVNWNTNSVEITPASYMQDLSPEGQAAAYFHEGIHLGQLNQLLGEVSWLGNISTTLEQTVYNYLFEQNQVQFEIQAYQAEKTYLLNYIGNSNHPYRPDIFNLLFDAEDELNRLQK